VEAQGHGTLAGFFSRWGKNPSEKLAHLSHAHIFLIPTALNDRRLIVANRVGMRPSHLRVFFA
jgi:hypothetical protein